jgi:hypothetical protein
MAYLQTKNANLVKFLEGLAMEDVSIHNLWPFGSIYGHLVYFVATWYILRLFGTFLTVL